MRRQIRLPLRRFRPGDPAGQNRIHLLGDVRKFAVSVQANVVEPIHRQVFLSFTNGCRIGSDLRCPIQGLPCGCIVAPAALNPFGGEKRFCLLPRSMRLDRADVIPRTPAANDRIAVP